jgi:FkbM family methyltransferase
MKTVSYGAFRLLQAMAAACAGRGLGRRAPGLVRLYERLRRATRPRHGIVTVRSHGRRLYVDAADTGFVPYLLEDGVYERFETSLFQGLIKPGTVVVDIGANVGYYTLLASDRVGADGRVYAFEPDPTNYALLVRNVRRNGCTNVVTVPRGVAAGRGVAELFLGSHNFGRHSFARANVPDPGGRVEIQTTGLDEFFVASGTSADQARIGVVKIDVEGAEGLVLQGARRTLAGDDVTVLMEFWPYGLRNVGTDPQALLDSLAASDFTIRVIDEVARQCVDEPDTAALTAACEARREGRGLVNLQLVKRAAARTTAVA